MISETALSAIPGPGSSAASDANLTLRVVSADELRLFQDAWERLAKSALVANVFYEPWMALAALETVPQTHSIRFLLIFGPKGADAAEPLWGLLPLQIERSCLKLPIRSLAFWQHRWCYLSVPLIDPAHVRAVLNAFWHWFEHNPYGCHLLDTNYLPCEGPFRVIWTESVSARASLMLFDFVRAALEPKEPAESYLISNISKKHRDEFSRQERRLRELGAVEYRVVGDVSEVDEWIANFLRLEKSGWKGGEGGRAFANSERDVEYFSKVTREGFARNRVLLTSLVLDGTPIAMKHSLLSGDTGFAFRIAYDEIYAKYSPGLLLELDTIRRVCENSRIRWMDSCAAPRHGMANRIWKERRMVRRTLFSDGSRLGDFWIAILPLLRWIGRRLNREPPPDYLQISTRLPTQRA